MNETPQSIRELADRITQQARYADNDRSRNDDLDRAIALRNRADELEEAIARESEQTITITTKEYAELQDQMLWLECLEGVGVDNWDGIEYAQEEYEIANKE